MPEKNQAMRVVTDLVSPFLHEWREVTADNLFSSIDLVNYLWQNQTYYTGTVRSNKPFIPPEFHVSKGREANTIIQGFNNFMILTSYFERKKKKPIIFISSKTIQEAVPLVEKPNVVQYIL